MPLKLKRRSTFAAITLMGVICGTAQSNPPHGHDAPAKVAPAPAKQPVAKPVAKPEAAPIAKPAPAKNTEKPAPDAHGEASAPAAPSAPVAAPAPFTPPTADEALQRLVDGNARWVSGKMQNPRSDAARREETATNGQKPSVSILTCSDSRIPLERVFDAGVGDLFVIRVAGNVAGRSESGTIEYGVEHLKTPLLVVLGHTKCGAVAATAGNAQVGGNIAHLVEHIQPAVARARKANPNADEKDLATACVKENVWQSVFDLLRHSSDVRHLVKDGKLKIVGGVYDIATGKVEWLGEHPWQDELVAAFDARDARRQAQAAAPAPASSEPTAAKAPAAQPPSSEHASHSDKPGH